MTTNTVTIEQSTISELVESLQTEFKKADVRDVKVHNVNPTRVRIETPFRRLAEYRFVADAGHCSWTTSKRKIILYLKSFSVEQRAEKQVLRLDLFEGNVIQSMVSNLVEGTRSDVRDIFVTRSLRAVEGLRSLDEDDLREAVKAPTDYSVLVRALNAEEALTVVRASDPLAAARLRGIDQKRRLLDSEGGAVSSSRAADMLKVTRQAVDKRRKEGKLLGLELGKRGYFYPSWQFGLNGLEEVLSALGTQDFWDKLSFFLNPSELLEGQTPLQALSAAKDIENVIQAAKTYGEHGA